MYCAAILQDSEGRFLRLWASLNTGSAADDARRHHDAEPDRLDIHRPLQRHLGMGQGIHFCVGASPGRAMAQFLFEELLPMSTRCEVDRGTATA
jgi:cytochrome P450